MAMANGNGAIWRGRNQIVTDSQPSAKYDIDNYSGSSGLQRTYFSNDALSRREGK